MKAYSICVLISAIGAMANYYDPIKGIGQLNERLARIAPNTIYLGSFGLKGWYAFNDPITQPTARSNCVNFGMKLGIIDSQSELEFIAIKVTEPLYHTDGNFLCKPSSFRWSTGLRELNPDLQILQADFGLLLAKVSKRLEYARGALNVFPYLCFISLIPGNNQPLQNVSAFEGGTIMKMSGFSVHVENGDLQNQTIKGLTYLGKYGYKSFYYDDALVLWAMAKENCEKMGMTFARMDSQDELEWIFSVIPNSQIDYVWTDGEIKQGSQHWYWISSGNNLNGGITMLEHIWGVVLHRQRRLLHACDKINTAYTFPYICFIASTI